MRAVGFRFGKSFRVPGGFRLNLSKKGIGGSWGLKGFRVGTGSRGTRVSAYIPGTGIGWSGSLFGGGSWGGAKRSHQRAASVEYQRLRSYESGVVRLEEAQRAAYLVACFENRLALLTSVHKESWNPWNWEAVAVHLNGLKLLRAMGDQINEAAREQVLDGLRAVVRRVGTAEA